MNTHKYQGFENNGYILQTPVHSNHQRQFEPQSHHKSAYLAYKQQQMLEIQDPVMQ